MNQFSNLFGYKPSYNEDKLTTAAKQKAGTQAKRASLGASDYAGYGIQLLGAMMADKQAKAQLQSAEEQSKKELERKGVDSRQEAERYEDDKQMRERDQNMQAMNMLFGQMGMAREEARKKPITLSMRQSFLKAGGM